MTLAAAQYYCFDCETVSKTDKCSVCGSIAREVDNLSRFMLRDRRQYVIDKVKAPIMKALIVLANRLKIEPTKQNTFHPNTHVLIDIWDKFFQTVELSREPLFRAVSKIVISEYEHDPYYRDRINIFLELLVEAMLKGNWKPRPLNHLPFNIANYGEVDPNIRGIGYEFMKDRYYHAEQYLGIKR